MVNFASLTLAAALALSGAQCSAPLPFGDAASTAPGTTARRITVGGRDRDYVLHIPKARRRNRAGILVPYSLVIVLHGSGADGQTVERQSGLDSFADANGWIVAYPNAVSGMLGFGSDWNAGSCCGIAFRDDVDDVGFITAVADDVVLQMHVDKRRVYLAGFSAGARMAYHVACRSASRIAAVAVVAGSMLDTACTPAMPVPLIAFHGTADDEVPYGEPAATPGQPAIAAASGLPPAIQFWSSVNGCQSLTALARTRSVTRWTFGHCRADLNFYSVAGGHHGWPGEPDGVGSSPPMSDVRATPLIAAFFARHLR